jgi:hypothetical protein
MADHVEAIPSPFDKLRVRERNFVHVNAFRATCAAASW